MSKESRQAHTAKLGLMASVRGHESSVAHAFNHTEGSCPKCGCDQQFMAFCDPNGRNMPAVPRCELDGEHVHRICRACKYPWIERCLDQAMLSEERGEMVAESEMASALAAFADRVGGICLERSVLPSYRGWVIRFVRDPERGTLTITSEAPPPQTGTPAHPQLQEAQG